MPTKRQITCLTLTDGVEVILEPSLVLFFFLGGGGLFSLGFVVEKSILLSCFKNTQNSISAWALFLRYSQNFANFSLDILIYFRVYSLATRKRWLPLLRF